MSMNIFRATKTTLSRRSVGFMTTRASSICKTAIIQCRCLSDTPNTSTAKSTSSGKQEPVILDPLVVCGPSGVGKGMVITRFFDLQQEQYTATLDMNDHTPQRN
jgi:hypothetical protein